MLCDFDTTSLGVRNFRHVCRQCGKVSSSYTAKLIAICAAVDQSSFATSPPSASAAVDRSRITMIRLGMDICRNCQERPAGCWRAVEYACTNAYLTAGWRAAEAKNCPIGKL